MIKYSVIENLRNNHGEADTKICFHTEVIDNAWLYVVIRAYDTDILVFLLYHCHKLTTTLGIDVGIASKNSRRYNCIADICNTLGFHLCAALPSFHAFTRSNYTSSFVPEGKVRTFFKLKSFRLIRH